MSHSKSLSVPRPRENNQVSRTVKNEERLSDRIEERTEGESAFQREGAIEAREPVGAISALVPSTNGSHTSLRLHIHVVGAQGLYVSDSLRVPTLKPTREGLNPIRTRDPSVERY